MEANELAVSVRAIVATINTTTDRYQCLIDHHFQQLRDGPTQLELLLDKLEATLDQADQQLAGWESSLEKVGDRITSLSTKACETIGQTHGFFSQFQMDLNQITTQFNESYQQIAAQFGELTEQTQQTHEQTLESLDEWVKGTQGALQTLEQHRNTLTQEFTELQEHGIKHFNTLGDDFNKLTDQTEQHLTDLKSHLDQSLQAMLNPLEQLWRHDIEHVLNDNAKNLSKIFDQFNAAGDQIDRVFDQNIRRILNQIEQVSKLLEAIKPVIDLANELI